MKLLPKAVKPPPTLLARLVVDCGVVACCCCEDGCGLPDPFSSFSFAPHPVNTQYTMYSVFLTSLEMGLGPFRYILAVFKNGIIGVLKDIF